MLNGENVKSDAKGDPMILCIYVFGKLVCRGCRTKEILVLILPQQLFKIMLLMCFLFPKTGILLEGCSSTLN